MALPTLEDLTDAMIATCDQIVGDTIAFKRNGGIYADLKGRVEYGEAFRDIATGIVVEQDIKVWLSKAACPTRPDNLCRITLPRITGIIYKPVNAEDVGTDWRFGVQRV